MNEVPKRTFAQRFHLKFIAWSVLFIVLLCGSAALTGVNWGEFFSNIGQFFSLIGKMAHPDWKYVQIVIQPVIQTLQMAIVGTTIGTLVAVPFSVVAARNLVKNPVIRGIIRFILNLVRTLPDLLLAAIMVAIVGIGPDRKSTRLNSSHSGQSRMPSSA